MTQQINTNQFTQFFIDMENKWLKIWAEKGIIEKYLNKNKNSEKYFSFEDGPITANNPMGVHHAWGRSYKDLWQKFYNLLGYKQRFHSGFDCQGLWVEVEVEKELGLKSKKDIENLVPGDAKASIAKFVQLCKDRVHKYADIQTEQSKRLGYFMDWENSYYTMSDENNFMIWHFLKKCHENGWIYKGHESVPWCPRCETAISQHEMLTEDYKEVVHDSVYFKLPIEGRTDEFLLVWTTTPWTIPANIAVAVDEKIDYSLVEGMTGDTFWVAKNLVESVFAKNYKKIVKTIKGSELVGLKYRAPFDELDAVKEVANANKEKFHTVVATDPLIMPITTEEGTGIVHTAVSAGTEDFKLGKKLGLPMIPVITDNASYLPNMGFLAGKNAKKHPELIFDFMKSGNGKGDAPDGGWIFEIRKIKHRYPGCWRCKTELVWKVADEWYIAMDLPSKSQVTNSKKQIGSRTLRERMVDVTKKINWMPEFGLDRELDWLKNMHDWLISKKNRYWGLALPIYVCDSCDKFTVIGSKDELKEKAVRGWDKLDGKSPHKPYIDEVIIACGECGKDAHRIGDVGNPWLDAGIVPFSTIKKNNIGEPLYLSDKKSWQKWFPVDFITESFPGQFKNWFYAMIAMSTVLEDTNPFKRVLGFATMVDEKGHPFHKSSGNAIEFVAGADTFGADLIRWSVIRSNQAENIPFGENMIRENRRQFYLLIWNVYKFFQINCDADKIQGDLPDPTSLNLKVLDLWILTRFKNTLENAKKYLEEFNSKSTTLELENFVQDLSTWYIRRSRNRVGPASSDKEDKLDFYATSLYVLKNLMIAISPIVPFISEEIFTNLSDATSVHLESWPDTVKIKNNEDLIHDMTLIRSVTEVGHRVRKENQLKVRQPLSLVSVFFPSGSNFLSEKNTNFYEDLIKSELNVKKVEFHKNSDSEFKVEFDTTITPELQLEGETRDLIRTIQARRKELGVSITDKVKITIPNKFIGYADFICNQVQAEVEGYDEPIEVKIA